MALRWDFKEPGGTVTIQKEDGTELTQRWFEGNALMIVLNEWEEEGTEYYSLAWFFGDVEHAKNCLGLRKGKDNMFLPDKITKLTINKPYCREWKKLIDLMIDAFPEIEISIVHSLEKEVAATERK